jgi:hypothetical protein
MLITGRAEERPGLEPGGIQTLVKDDDAGSVVKPSTGPIQAQARRRLSKWQVWPLSKKRWTDSAPPLLLSKLARGMPCRWSPVSVVDVRRQHDGE